MKLYNPFGGVSLLLLAAAISGCNNDSTHTNVDMQPSKSDGKDWISFGGNTREDHFSPLSQISQKTIQQLGLEWSIDLPIAPSSGVSAPLAVDGTLFYAVGHSILYAVDAATGELKWRYDPKVYDVGGKELRGAWGIRGIAYADGKVYTGTADGRLIAVDAHSGERVWSADTTTANDGRYITGQPYIIGKNVIIGHGGADFGPVRGYVTAYDLQTGKQAWRFYTVPGNPENGFENDAMKMAADTWTGEWWKYGGGGTAWNAMAYDEELNRVYVGTGNGAPWNQKIRSPEGGDNLFLCSIIALDADTGEYLWHYQVNPGETWDFNAAMGIKLADIEIDGETRKVLMQAPKNGFFYVIDRLTGKLISAEPFARQNWAEYIDKTTGRPVELPGIRFPKGSTYVMSPNAFGAHGVEAMSYNPNSKLVYLPTRNKSSAYTDPQNIDDWKFNEQVFLDSGIGAPSSPQEIPASGGWLAAWNPVEQKEAWRVELSHTHNGGTLTAADWVMQGRSTGELAIYNAYSGEKIWSYDAQVGVQSHPITYEVNGKQYISLLTGWRGSTYSGEGPRWNYHTQKRRVLTFALGGNATLPDNKTQELPIIDPETFSIDEQLATAGQGLYHKTCFICHGAGLMSGGAAPDLLRSAIPTSFEGLKAVLHDGALVQRGMPLYDDLSEDDIRGLLHYIRRTARTQESAAPPVTSH